MLKQLTQLLMLKTRRGMVWRAAGESQHASPRNSMSRPLFAMQLIVGIAA